MESNPRKDSLVMFWQGMLKVFGYLSLLSEISTIDTGDGSMTSLRQKYDNVKYIFKGSLLASYCKPELYKSEESSCPMMIFPFGCNESQYNAVRNALENRLSVIQGPPGTGKTQTILNIIANLLLYGKNCLISTSLDYHLFILGNIQVLLHIVA